MPDALAIIKRAIAEHHTIREHVKLAGDTISDFEALVTLQQQQSGWSQTSVADMIEKQSQMQKTTSFMEHGLRNHFDFEERDLLPLLGELLQKAILNEHREVYRQIDNTKATLAGIKLEGLEQRELLSKRSEIQHAINKLFQAVDEHMRNEEMVLGMMIKGLEA